MIGLISTIINVLQILILVDVVLSWVKPNAHEFPRNLTTQVTDPLYAPIRAFLNPQSTGGLDLAPLLILLLLGFMKRMITSGNGS